MKQVTIFKNHPVNRDDLRSVLVLYMPDHAALNVLTWLRSVWDLTPFLFDGAYFLRSNSHGPMALAYQVGQLVSSDVRLRQVVDRVHAMFDTCRDIYGQASDTPLWEELLLMGARGWTIFRTMLESGRSFVDAKKDRTRLVIIRACCTTPRTEAFSILLATLRKWFGQSFIDNIGLEHAVHGWSLPSVVIDTDSLLEEWVSCKTSRSNTLEKKHQIIRTFRDKMKQARRNGRASTSAVRLLSDIECDPRIDRHLLSDLSTEVCRVLAWNAQYSLLCNYLFRPGRPLHIRPTKLQSSPFINAQICPVSGSRAVAVALAGTGSVFKDGTATGVVAVIEEKWWISAMVLHLPPSLLVPHRSSFGVEEWSLFTQDWWYRAMQVPTSVTDQMLMRGVCTAACCPLPANCTLILHPSHVDKR